MAKQLRAARAEVERLEQRVNHAEKAKRHAEQERRLDQERITQLEQERDEAVNANHSVAVCSAHTSEVIGTGCVVCERDEARDACRKVAKEYER